MRKGFSLIELLIYTGLFAVAAGLLTGITLTVTRVQTQESAGLEVTRQSQFIMQRIQNLVRQSSDVEEPDAPEHVCVGDICSLKLRMENSALDPTCITVENDIIKLAQGPGASPDACSSTKVALTTDKVKVGMLKFSKIVNPGGHSIVNVDLTLNYNSTNPLLSGASKRLTSAVSRVSAATFDSNLLPNADNTWSIGAAGTPGTVPTWKNILMVNGTAANPSYSFGASSTTGIFSPATDILGFSTASSERMRIDAIGNVGIGTTSPTAGYKLTVAGFINSNQTVNQSTIPSVSAVQTASTLQDGSTFIGTDATMSTMYQAVKFTASAAHTMGDFTIGIKESADITNTTGAITGYIYADDGGSPSKPTGSALATGTSIRFGAITTTYQVLSVGTTYTMVSGASYWLVLKWNATPTGGNIILNSNVSTNMGVTSSDGITWTNNDAQFRYAIRGRTYISLAGTSTNNYGTYGSSTNSTGVYGTSTNYYGVYGRSTNSYGGIFYIDGAQTINNAANTVLIRRYSSGAFNATGNVLQITDNPTVTGTISGALISGSIDGTTRLNFDPRVADGASAVAYMLDTKNTLANATSKLFELRNSGTAALTILGSGNVGIGTTTPSENLHISSSGETNVRIDTSATAGSIRMKFYPTGLGIVALQGFGANGINLSSQGQSIVFGTGTGGAMDGGFNIRMVIANNGNVGIGAWDTSNLPDYQLQLSTNSAAKPTSTAWTVPSDIRIKKDISPFTDGLNVIDKINPVNYRLNGKAGLPMDAPGIGVIAQEVKDIIPYTIKTWKTRLNPDDKEETVLYDFDASPMTFVLINAVKEQQEQIEELASEIKELKSRLSY